MAISPMPEPPPVTRATGLRLVFVVLCIFWKVKGGCGGRTSALYVEDILEREALVLLLGGHLG